MWFGHEYCDSKGQLIILNVQIKEKNYFLINLYGLNKDAEAVGFYQDLSTTLQGVDLDSDLNCPLDPTLDKNGGIPISRQHVINSSESFQNEFSLHDIWRVKNPKTRRYTWCKSSPFIFCRLNYWLILDNLNDLVTQVDIGASIKTDHFSIILELEDNKDSRKGFSFNFDCEIMFEISTRGPSMHIKCIRNAF